MVPTRRTFTEARRQYFTRSATHCIGAVEAEILQKFYFTPWFLVGGTCLMRSKNVATTESNGGRVEEFASRSTTVELNDIKRNTKTLVCS